MCTNGLKSFYVLSQNGWLNVKKNRETCGAALPPDELLRSPLLVPHLALHLNNFNYLFFTALCYDSTISKIMPHLQRQFLNGYFFQPNLAHVFRSLN